MKKLIIPVFLMILCFIPVATLSQVFSIWADEQMTSICVETDEDSITFFSFYIYLDPGEDGAFAAEYMIRYLHDDIYNPKYVIVNTEASPAISIVKDNPYGEPGVSVSFLTCQTDLFWIYRYDMAAIFVREKKFVYIEPRDDTGKLGIVTCTEPLRPYEDGYVWNMLFINNCCPFGGWEPWLESAEAILRNKVAGYFDSRIYPGWEYTPETYPFDEHFMVYSIGDPSDTISIVNGEWIGASTDSCLLTLERSMLGEVQYKLVADVCGGTMGNFCCAVTEQEFTCPVIATQLQQFSAAPSAGTVTLEWRLSSIDPGTAFHILRREPDEPFTQVGEMAGSIEELSYRFEDRSISGGNTYVYRVEYVSDTDRGVLFETDAIETAPIPVTLAQNHPNPFNPNTTIAFYIPEAEHISLRVFDVSGRLVRTLVDDTREIGSHNVTWDGLDNTGNSVPSGVYFSRLRAGKATLSKKMILLR